jgi:hypothetical protein
VRELDARPSCVRFVRPVALNDVSELFETCRVVRFVRPVALNDVSELSPRLRYVRYPSAEASKLHVPVRLLFPKEIEVT